MKQFFTRERANLGVTLPLSLPDGTATEHTISLYGVDSDQFRRAQAASNRRMLELAQKDAEAKGQEVVIEERLRLLAALVKSWTFELPSTEENVVSFLREAPQVADQIDRITANRKLFFRLGSSNSTPTLEPNSG